MLLILSGFFAGVIIASVVYSATGFSLFGRADEKPSASVDSSNAELTALAYGVLEYIRDGDYQALSRVAHPDFGVVFSPYATVSLSTNRRFSAVQIAGFENDTNVYVWGVQDGSGEPIELTPAGYIDEYVYYKDFCSASLIGVNRIVKSGNALENITDEFPGVKFVDFHIPGGEKDSPDELAWGSLRLGFEEYNGALWLTVVINSRWTI